MIVTVISNVKCIQSYIHVPLFSQPTASTRNKTFKLKKPGAYHHARFMGKSIYLLKIYILSLLFARLTQRQTRDLDRVVLFILTIYGMYFLKSCISVIAPRVDLQLLRQLTLFESVDSQISKISLKVFQRHLWYLTPELVVLCLFDRDSSDDDKAAVAKELLKHKIPKEFESGKPKFDTIENLVSYVSAQSWFLFEKSRAFLCLETEESPSYS